jgi:hypothetical protein
MELAEYLQEFFKEISPDVGVGTPYREALIPMVCGYAVGLSTTQLKHLMAVRAYLGSATAALNTNRKPEIPEMAKLVELHKQGVHFKAATIQVFPESDIQEKYISELRKYV